MHREMGRWSFLVVLLLAGCSASSPYMHEPAGEPSLAFLCDEEMCGFYPYEGLVEATGEEEEAAGASPGTVVLARNGGTAVGIALPGAPGSSPGRYRGWPLRLPEDRGPVFVIPWRNHLLRNLLPSQKQLLEEAERRMRRPHERHHIFPQELELKKWFTLKGINIHEHTLFIDKELHARLHRGPRGGPWNEAWRQFKQQNEGATEEELWRHAWELCVRFGLYGPIEPYYRHLRIPLP